MPAPRLIFVLLTAALLAACAEEPAQPRMSFGPPSYFPHMAPTTGVPSVRGMSGWSATDENFRSATPPPFTGY